MPVPKLWAKNFMAIFRIFPFSANLLHMGKFRLFQLQSYYTQLDWKIRFDYLFEQKHGREINIFSSETLFWSILSQKWTEITNFGSEAEKSTKYLCRTLSIPSHITFSG